MDDDDNDIHEVECQLLLCEVEQLLLHAADPGGDGDTDTEGTKQQLLPHICNDASGGGDNLE